MNNWKMVKLSTLCSRIGDGLHGTPKYVDYGNVFFINGNNLKEGKIEINDDTKRVSEDDLKMNFILLDSFSLLIGINGTIGNMAFYNGQKLMLGKSAAYLNFKSEINRFYYFYFQLPRVQKHFYDIATGSTIKNLSLRSLNDFEVPFPNDDEGNKIVSVLSSLDNKIDLNNQINDNLQDLFLELIEDK
ncbi:restriction endonuclease subunit S [Chryseobacterium vaccae]|uniref:restriction endonuclease subunit S n=1 Tax=Chryseobacterium vaccae TaxID=2604424 RepID=UPI0012975072|nr:restriction endonuclease subunit S [Chryseobacterium vaccae]